MEKNKKSSIFGVRFSPSGAKEAAKRVFDQRNELKGEYICFANVHVTVMAHDDEDYRRTLNNSAYTFADGAPVAKLLRKQGFEESQRVAGPDFMADIFSLGSEDKENIYYNKEDNPEDVLPSHFFYGSTEETLEKLKSELLRRYPGLRIAGMYSPPFRRLTEKEDEEVIRLINGSGADFIWIGLGAPKQEKWMEEHKGKLCGVMLGVGAGFDFHSGVVKRAPGIFQKLSLEWLYRLLSDPKRLFRRYLVTNTKFILYTRGLKKG